MGKILINGVLAAGVILTLGCAARPVSVRRAQTYQLPELSETFTLYQQNQYFPAGESRALESNPQIRLRIVTENAGEPLEVELRDADSGKTYLGKVDDGKPVSFAPELVGTSGLTLLSRDEHGATFQRQWCEEKRTAPGDSQL